MKLKLCELVSNLEYIDLEGIKTYLNREDTAIRDWAYIIHDKDVAKDGNPKAKHIHLSIRLKDAYDTKYVASWFGVSEQFIGKCKGRWSDMLSYLTHSNAPDKHQYSPDEVISNFDWITASKGTKEDTRRVEIINGIVDGTIREYNYFSYISAEEYVKYKNAIDCAYKYRADKLKGVHRTMDCMYVTGGSGTGKTTYAKQIASENGYSVFISSGSNDILDGYKGEDCIILDDLRPSCIGLSDLLKMLDNNTSSSVKSRYRNKVLECKMIIITSVLPLEQFYKGVFESENEPIEQFKRRCKVHVTLTKEYLNYKMYDDFSGDYIDVGRCENPVAMYIPQSPMSVEEARNKLNGILNMNLNFVEENKARLKNVTLDEFVR